MYGLGAGIGALTHALNGFAPQLAHWVSYLTPFHYYNASQPLTNGLDPGNTAVPLGVTILCLAIGTWRLSNRDLNH